MMSMAVRVDRQKRRTMDRQVLEPALVAGDVTVTRQNV